MHSCGGREQRGWGKEPRTGKKRCLFVKEEHGARGKKKKKRNAEKLVREEERAGNERGSFRKSGDAFIVLQVLAHTRLIFSWFS